MLPLNLEAAQTQTKGQSLFNSIAEIGLNYVMNDTPTFVSRINGEWNILDLAFSSDKLIDDILEFEIGPPTESDHFPIIMKINYSTNQDERVKKIKDWKKFQDELKNNNEINEMKLTLIDLKGEAKTEDCNISSICDSIDACVNAFTCIVNRAQSNSMTTRKVKIKKDFKINSDTREMIKERRRLVDLIKTNKNRIDVTTLKTELNKTTTKMRSLLKRDQMMDFEKKTNFIAESKDGKKKWKIFNDLMNRKKRDNATITHFKKKMDN